MLLPMDPDLKTLLTALVEGQVKLAESLETSHARLSGRVDKLAEGQAKLTERVDKLAEGQAKLAARMDGLAIAVNELTGDVGVLATAVRQMGERMDAMGARLDRFGEQVMRGFTRAGGQLEEHEGRIVRLEQATFGAGPPAPPR
jgi:methyl-accepting chemotaxis protein